MPKKPHAAAPVIETERLRLRGFVREDLPRFCQIWNDPAVYRFITGKPLSEENQWARMRGIVGQWPLSGFGMWAVEDKSSGLLIGQCGFLDVRREMPVPMPEPEMGWALAAEYHGRGIGTEVCRAIVNWGDENLGVEKTACITAPENTVSNRLAEMLGFLKVADTVYMNEPTWLFHRKRGTT